MQKTSRNKGNFHPEQPGVGGCGFQGLGNESLVKFRNFFRRLLETKPYNESHDHQPHPQTLQGLFMTGLEGEITGVSCPTLPSNMVVWKATHRSSHSDRQIPKLGSFVGSPIQYDTLTKRTPQGTLIKRTNPQEFLGHDRGLSIWLRLCEALPLKAFLG